MKPKIAVFGNTTRYCGYTIAADLTLAGYEVNFLELPELQQTIEPIQKIGGIHLAGEKQALRSGKTGFAKLRLITTDAKEALEDVDVIFIDVSEFDYEKRFKTIAPFLRGGQVINFNTYGYWACLRVVNILKEMRKENVILTESPAAIYYSTGESDHVTSIYMRRGLPLAVFPSKKSREAFDVLKPIYPTFEMAENVLQTNFENLNMLVHPGIAILNIGFFDRAQDKGEPGGFYQIGNTVHTGIFSEAQDKERIKVCQAYGVPYTPLKERIIGYYDSKGKTIHETILNCNLYQKLTPLFPADIWVQWLSKDIPLAHVPFVSIADLAGISTPIHRAIIEIVGAVLEDDFWENGLTLDKLGLAGLTTEEVVRFVTDG